MIPPWSEIFLALEIAEAGSASRCAFRPVDQTGLACLYFTIPWLFWVVKWELLFLFL